MRDQASQADMQLVTICRQPQLGCDNLQHAGCTIVTHRSSHDIETIPFTPFSVKTSKAFLRTNVIRKFSQIRDQPHQPVTDRTDFSHVVSRLTYTTFLTI